MSSTDPIFTIVIATWGRGEHLLPTLRSVQAQDLGEFECLIIGDACTSGFETHVADLGDPRFRAINQPLRAGTQSGPNNRGVREAVGRYIAFLGHDDIWAPHHLSSLQAVFERGNVDCVVSGMLAHPLSPGLETGVIGLFADEAADEAAARDFFPPTTTAMTASIARAVGPWAAREVCQMAVDKDLQLRLVKLGAAFRSTGQITAHKFGAAARYLSYLQVSSREQDLMLTKVTEKHADGSYDAWVGAFLEQARKTGYAPPRLGNPVPGKGAAAAARADLNRGLDLPDLQRLDESGVEIPQDAGRRGRDWLPMRDNSGVWRRTGPNASPALLVPVTGKGRAMLEVPMRLPSGMHRQLLEFECNGLPVQARFHVTPKDLRSAGAPQIIARLRVRLRARKPSILRIHQPYEKMVPLANGRRAGVSVGTVRVMPWGGPETVG